MDQMLECLAGNEYYCFLDGFLGYFQISTPGTFQRCMMAIFHDMIRKRWRCEDTKLALNWEKSHFMVKEGIVLGYKISKKGIEFIFSNECIQAFRTLKVKLTEASILIALNWDQPFELMCDANDYVVGAVLGQRIEKYF
nr:hypothetical protein [Tanacetum cinerariifolium]